LKKSNKKILLTFLWLKYAVDLSNDPWLLNGEVVCSSRFLFLIAANCTWLPLSISKVPIFLCHLLHVPCIDMYCVFLHKTHWSHVYE
jgi:hypothetical protein